MDGADYWDLETSVTNDSSLTEEEPVQWLGVPFGLPMVSVNSDNVEDVTKMEVAYKDPISMEVTKYDFALHEVGEYDVPASDGEGATATRGCQLVLSLVLLCGGFYRELLQRVTTNPGTCLWRSEVRGGGPCSGEDR